MIAESRIRELPVSGGCKHRRVESAQPQPRWSRSRDRPRPHSRRGERRLYLVERLSNEASRERKRQQPPEVVEALVEAAKTGSALRRRLVAAGIDPKIARLVLLFYGRRELRVADVAWLLGVSPSTACRLLDRAERTGLVDKSRRPRRRLACPLAPGQERGDTVTLPWIIAKQPQV